MNTPKNPFVTIVTPAYNQASYLPQAIESVLKQDYPHIEYIVLDDGSTDGTRDVLKAYTGRLRWETQPNLGQAHTLNKGWRLGKGLFLGYLSADDILAPQAISEAVHLLQSSNDVVMVYPNCNLIDHSSRVIRRGVAREFDYASLVIDQECYVGPGALFRRSVFEATGGWRPELVLAPDREFWMRVGLLGRCFMIPRILASYRVHPDTISFRKANAHIASEYVRVAEEYFSLPDVPPDLLAKKNLALSRAYLVEARIHLRAGRPRSALKSFRHARQLDPNLSTLDVLIKVGRALASRPYHRIWWWLRGVSVAAPYRTSNRPQ